MLLAPWFLLGLLTLGIPLVIHLRRSTQVRTMVFSTTRFFDETFVRAARRARLQDLLLMVLRMVLLALFVLAFSQPLLRLPGMGRLALWSEGTRTVALVIDDSGSMGALSGSRTLLEAAKAGALALLDELSSARGDRVTVVLAGQRDGGPVVLFNPPTQDIPAARRALAEIEATDLGTDLSAAVAAAAATVKDARHPDVVVFSDMQETGLGAAGTTGAGPTTPLLLVRVGVDTAAGNMAVRSVTMGASRPMVGVPFTFRGLVENDSPQPRRVEARLIVGGEVMQRRPLELAPGRGEVVRFVHAFPRGGWFDGCIEVAGAEADAWDADNRRWFAVSVADAVSMLAVSGAPSSIAEQDELLYFRLALRAGQSGDHITLDQVAPAQLAKVELPRYPVLMLANVGELDEATVAAVERYVDGGGSLLVTLGDRTDAGKLASWSHDHRLHGGLLPGMAGDAMAVEDTIGSDAAEHPALAGVVDAMTGTAIRKLTPVESDPAWVLWRTQAGRPLLLERSYGAGRVMLWTTSIDRDWCSAPVQPGFVPLVQRLVMYLAQPPLGKGGFVETGQMVPLPSAVTSFQALRIQTPGGGSVYPKWEQTQPQQPPVMVMPPGLRAGVYVVQGGPNADAATHRLAVNIPVAETKLAELDRDAMAGQLAPGTAWAWVEGVDNLAQRERTVRQGYALWNQLLVAALLVALFEPWLANRLSRKRTAG